MSEPFLGEIRMVGFNFAPVGWAKCDGQLVSIAQNSALFSIMYTTFGGDGQTTFALPDLRGRVPIHTGMGPGLSPRSQGEKGGQEAVTLLAPNMPAHGHPVLSSPDLADTVDPADHALGVARKLAYAPTGPNAPMAPASVGMAGGSAPHPNMQPYLAVTFIIALFGIYPSQG